MTKVEINPGPCGFVTRVTAQKEGRRNVKIQVETKCEAVQKMMDSLGDTFNSFDVCLVRPGKGPFYDFASENFPVHVGCPVIPGIVKCVEGECGLALKKNADIRFITEET
jgi:hypothetical protein